MPNKKDTVLIGVLIGGRRVAKRHLLYSKLYLYKQFKKANPDSDRKLITFLKVIPKNYKCLNLTCRRVCVCTRHYNLEQKIEALNRFAQTKKLPELKTTSRNLSNVTVCHLINSPDCVSIETAAGVEQIPLKLSTMNLREK